MFHKVARRGNVAACRGPLQTPDSPRAHGNPRRLHPAPEAGANRPDPPARGSSQFQKQKRSTPQPGPAPTPCVQGVARPVSRPIRKHPGKPWRRVPESNRSSRICNPAEIVDFIESGCKRARFVHCRKSTTYGPPVNDLRAGKAGNEIAEGAGTRLGDIQRITENAGYRHHPCKARIAGGVQ